MDILKIILLAAIILICSLIVGCAADKLFKQKQSNMFRIFLTGELVILAVFWVVASPMYLFQRRFLELMFVWGILKAALLSWSVWYAHSRYARVWERTKTSITAGWTPLKVIMAVLIGLHVLFVLWFIVYNNMDDWYWMGEANAQYTTGWLNRYYPSTGMEYNRKQWIYISSKYYLAPWPTMMTVLSKLMGLHPTITAHVLMSVLTVLNVFIILFEFARLLFKNSKEQQYLFVIVLIVIKLFNNFSFSYYSCYLYLMPWQGKALMTSLMFPVIFYYLAMIRKNRTTALHREWLLLGIGLIACMAVNSLGALLGPSIVLCVILVYTVTEREWRYLRNGLLVCLPELVGMVCAAVLKFLG